jgi:hypothetical protein
MLRKIATKPSEAAPSGAAFVPCAPFLHIIHVLDRFFFLAQQQVGASNGAPQQPTDAPH